VKHSGILAVILALTVLLGGTAFATTYYVSTSGNDGNTGLSPAAAWRHVNYAAGQAVAGDTVIILAGTYNERVEVVNKIGTAQAPIVFKNNPGDVVTVDGTGINVPINYNDGLFEIRTSKYITVEGLRVINSSYCGIATHGTGVPGATTNITIRNCYTYNTAAGGIVAHGHAKGGSWTAYDCITDYLVENCEVDHAMMNGYEEILTICGGVDGFIIRNNHVHDGGPGLVDGGPLGIDAKYGVRNGEIYGNIVHHIQRSSGIYVDAWDTHTYNIKIYNNLVHNCDDSGIQVGGEQGGDLSNIDIYNNIVYDNGGGCTGLDAYGSGICINSGRGTFTNINIYNNTVFHNNIILSPNNGGIMVWQQSATGSIINNISTDNNTWGQIIMGVTKPNTVMVVDHNLIYPSVGTHKYAVTGTNYILADPLFVNGSTHDFHLQSGSPAKNSGTASLAPTFDYDNVARPQESVYDRGAFEYVGGPQPPVANFSGNPTSGPVPLTVYFTDLSSGSPTSWSWTFGDGGTSTAQNPSHQYTTASQYTVSLTATNAQGSDTETKTNYITVVQAQDYFCNSMTVNIGTLQSGDHTSVHASDNTYLVVRSAKSGGKQKEQVTYTFNTGLGSLSSLAVTVEGKVSAGTQPQTVYAYNYSTSSWTSVSTSTLTTSDSTVNPTVSNPSQYISAGTVQVRVYTGGSGSTQYDHSTDYVKITAAP